MKRRLAHTFDQMLERLQLLLSMNADLRRSSRIADPLTILKGQIEVTLNRPRNSSIMK